MSNLVNTSTPIAWTPTLKLALGRGAASGLMIIIIAGLAGQFKGATLMGVLGFYVFWTVGSVVGATATFYVIKAISAVLTPIAGGIVALACNIYLFMVSIMIAIGDPIVFLLNKQFPNLFECADLKLINMQPLMIVREPPLAAQSMGA
jgi:hypothetical protein